MRILILGANGYLGARLFFDLRKEFDVVGTYHRTQFFSDFIQLDITKEDDVLAVFKKYAPGVVIQTANYPSPRDAQNNEEPYKKLNFTSTQYIRKAADAVGAKIVFISSFAARNPSDIYGELKLKSEEEVKWTRAGYLVLRPAFILGMSPNTTNDRPFNRILKSLDEKRPGTFDTSWRFHPTYVGHIARVIAAAIRKNVWNRTIHVVCPSIQTQYSTAKDVLAPFGITVTPVDKHINIPLSDINENELTDLGLPACNYEEMIHSIHEEIRHRDRFTLERFWRR